MRTLPRNGIAWVNETASDAMVQEAKRAFPDETGGVCIGYWTHDSKNVVILDAIGPGPHATHGRKHFVPDTAFHRAEISRLYQASGRLHTYLGDWHSHPMGSPGLSRRDLRTLRKISNYSPARAKLPLMLILSGSRKWNLKVWCYWPRDTLNWLRSRLLPLEVQIFR